MNVTPPASRYRFVHPVTVLIMPLVDPAYRNEFAVLATWLSALLPWSVWWFSGSLGVIEVRFPLVVARFVTDAPDAIRTPYFFMDLNARAAGAGASELGYAAALAGAACFAVALLGSVVLAVREEAVEARLPRSPASILGGLLVLSGVVFAAATYQLWTAQRGLTVPLGVGFQLGFGLILLLGEQSP